VSAVLLVEPVG